MGASNKKLKIAIGIGLFAVSMLVVFAQIFVYVPVSHPGEGYMDPAYAIHITLNGAVTEISITHSSDNIHRNGNIYTLVGNVTNWIIVEKSNIVLNGGGFTLSGNHGISLQNVSNVTVRDLNVRAHYGQTLLQNVKNSVFQNVTSGFRILDSDNNVISNSGLSADLINSNHNTIKDSTSALIHLSKSNNNYIVNNSIWAQGPSMGFMDSSNNVVFGNNFEKFWWWLSIGGSSTNNKIVANNIWAGQLYQVEKLSGTNYIYHNNFWNFKWDHSKTTNSANVWSSEGRGNYWDNFHGGDFNGDGIVDSPYVIDQTNKDNYPLTQPVNLAAEPFP